MLKMKSILLVPFVVAMSLLCFACGGGSSGGTTPDDSQTQNPQSTVDQFAGTYDGRYEGTWMGINDSGDLQLIIDSDGNVTVKSQGYIGFGSATDTAIDSPEGDLNILIANWATVDDSGVISVVGLGTGETADIKISSGIIQGTWNAPNGDHCILTVNEGTYQDTPPVAQITSPAEGLTFAHGEVIQFVGSGADNEDGPLNGSSLVWSSDVDGQIGTGQNCTSNTLSAGAHLITLTATDSLETVGTNTVSIIVANEIDNPNDLDNDGDGYTENQGDCNDSNSGINPMAAEICGDGIDQDCNGSDLICPNVDDGLGPCSGTAEECEAARLINEYRASHIHEGECNHPLKWNDDMGKLAHDWQQSQGPNIEHSHYGYVENVGYAYGLSETVEWIIEYDPGLGEDHCAPDGSYVASHHCAAMFCANKTVGVGVYVGENTGFGTAYYITMIFGDENGEPDWDHP